MTSINKPAKITKEDEEGEPVFASLNVTNFFYVD